MSVPQNIQELANKVRNEIYGKDVRESIAKSMEATGEVAEWSRQVAQDIVDGKFDEGELATEIERKLNDLETQYAPQLTSVRSEVENARGNEPNLGDRLNSVDSQLAQNTDRIIIANNFVEYGLIKLPSELPKKLPFDIYRDFDGRIKHTFDFDQIDTSGQNVYIDFGSGNDTNDGLTETTAVRSLDKAMEVLNDLSGSTANLVFKERFYPITSISSHYQLNKHLNMLSLQEGGTTIYSGHHNGSYTWILDDGVYKTNRTLVYAILDYDQKDFRGFPRELKKVQSLEECKDVRGTWYTDGTTVYVNRLNGESPQAPNNRLALILPFDASLVLNSGGNQIFVDNISFAIRQSANTLGSGIRINGNNVTDIIFRNSKTAYSRMNGFHLNRFRHAFMFNSDALQCSYDGFNYHTQASANPYGLVFEYECFSRGHGDNSGGTGNATSAHEGLTIIRVGCVGHDTLGPVLADVNGCHSYNIDCTMYNSLIGSQYPTKAAYYFDAQNAQKEGKVWLINCGGGGGETLTVNTDGNIPVYVKNLKGSNIPKDVLESITVLN